MARDARGNSIPDAALRNRVAYLITNPVWYSTTRLSDIDDNRIITGTERLRYD